MTVFGNYNKELYEDYGIFAYGGCDGKTVEDLADDFLEILLENIQYAPDKTKKSYGNLYRLQEVSALVDSAEVLIESDVFLEQIEAYLKSNAIEDVTDMLLSKMSNSSEVNGMQDKLSLAKDYEEGEFDVANKEGEGAENANTEDAKLEKDVEVEDTSGGNPLEVFTDIMRDGVLNLVCNASALSEGIVAKRDTVTEVRNNMEADEVEDLGAADYLKGIISESGEENTKESWEAEKKTSKGINKVKYICYGNEQFSCYTEDKERTAKYGREYLIAGKKEEKDNLSHVVNKLLRTRLLLNFVSIAADPLLQQKSLATATTLAGFTGIPPVIYAVQYVILLILAFEEACVDVTALLEGRGVPIVKSAADLKMRYEEICLVSKALFVKKAKEYPKKETATGMNITYEQYLWLFLLGESEEELHDRSLDLIQCDLREKYNQTFLVETSICSSDYIVQYRIPFLFEKLPFISAQQDSTGVRELEVKYGYKSG